MWNVLRDVLVRLRSLEQDVLALEMYPTVAQQLRYLADLIEHDAGRRTYAHYLATIKEGGESNGHGKILGEHGTGRERVCDVETPAGSVGVRAAYVEGQAGDSGPSSFVGGAEWVDPEGDQRLSPLRHTLVCEPRSPFLGNHQGQRTRLHREREKTDIYRETDNSLGCRRSSDEIHGEGGCQKAGDSHHVPVQQGTGAINDRGLCRLKGGDDSEEESKQEEDDREARLLTDTPGCGTCGGPWVPVAGGGRTVAHGAGCLWWGNGW